MDIFKRHTKTTSIHGLGTVLDLDQDKPAEETYEQIMHRKAEEEKQAQALRNRRFDPLYMESDLPDAPDTGDISLDPNDMTFNFE